MRSLARWVLPVAVLGMLAALVVPGIASNIEESDLDLETECGQVNIAVNAWVGYEANAYVIGEVARQELGCIVDYVYVDENISWQGFANGQIDAVVENWGHPELFDLYDKELGVAERAGSTGVKGVIGWYVPPWMAEKYPDITNWKNLNKYADLFKTSESGGKGQLLDGDPGFVTNDEALVANLDLNFEVVFAGSEAALIQSFRTAQENKEPMIGYFYSPQWFLSEVPLVKVDLPKYTKGCDADPEKVDCDYPAYDLDKIVSTQFAESDSPGYRLIRNFKWTDDEQNVVAKYIAEDGMTGEEAADKWIDDNPDKVKEWLPAS